ncbi:MAG TPA: YbaL family putative K(+) efflux transporter [Polyangiaceae bacterium]|nr:YbaL family putative K(+) efflux transporter [Polyangiaceae bacterium]
MPHETALLATLAAGLGLAFLFGLGAARLKLPPILGYLVAGMAIGPFTPGFVADVGLAGQLSEIGVILLMFGVGLHFSIDDLLAVRRIAVPGAIGQIAVATAIGCVLAHAWGWTWGAGLVFGLCLSVASTVVLLRALEDRGALESADGRIAVGWLIVEDLVTVLALVLLPAVAPMLRGEGDLELSALGGTLALTLVKVGAFVGLMLVVGRRVVPWVLGRVVRTGSRELFTLAVLAIALGIAVGVAGLFGVSFALGAFFAGVVVSESDFSHEAATNALPLQDAFAVLFFVSVGMLFDPAVLIRQPLQVIAAVAVVLLGKSLAALAIVLAYRYSVHTALTIAASLAQIGEFSFILVALAVSLGLIPQEAQSLVVAVAIVSITVHPLMFRLVDPVDAWIRARRGVSEVLERPAGELTELPPAFAGTELNGHVVVVGSGRVGAPVAEELARHRVPYVIVEQSRERAEQLREQGLPVLYGDASRPEVLTNARLERAKLVLVTAPDAYQARATLSLGKRLNPEVEVVVRTHSDDERDWLEHHGASYAMMSERELAVSMTRHALRRYGVEHDMVQVAQRVLRPVSKPDT